MPTMTQRLHKAFPYNEWAPRHITRHNRRQWIRSVRFLGPKWVALQYVERTV